MACAMIQKGLSSPIYYARVINHNIRPLQDMTHRKSTNMYIVGRGAGVGPVFHPYLNHYSFFENKLASINLYQNTHVINHI
jgi:hypothetical protein